MTTAFDDPRLGACLDRAWACLEAGAAPGRSRFSMAQAATVGLDGRPRVRTIVLRAVDAAARTVAFHTDIRSPKVAELAREPRISLLGYDMEAGLQVRLEGVATVHAAGPVKAAAWGDTRPRSRICYRSGFAPGAPLDRPELGDPTAAHREPADPAEGFANFARVETAVEMIEWLDLAASGHRRALFRWDGAGWAGTWIAP